MSKQFVVSSTFAGEKEKMEEGEGSLTSIKTDMAAYILTAVASCH